jgi:RimJ/RimL family protein N-acetyltransferase
MSLKKVGKMYKHKNGITLKKLEKEDLVLLKYLKNESWFGTHNISFVNDLDQENWFSSLNSNRNLFLIAYKENTQEKIGLYKIQNIDWINRKYDSAHDVFDNQRGKGYSKPVLEAGVDFGFEVLNMNRIDTEVLENNLASYKSALYVGFIQEGIKRKCIHKCGEYLDSNFLGILREDWMNLERIQNYGKTCNLSYIPKNYK